jgi:hypothetical protein
MGAVKMQKSLSWRDHAISRISNALLEYEAQCACLGEEINPKDARKWVNDRYPFGIREHSPYKIWLEELKLIEKFLKLGEPAKYYPHWRNHVTSRGESGSTRKSKAVVYEGQLSLF